MIFKGNILGASLLASAISTMFGIIIWLLLDRLLPFLLILSPFFLLLSIPVSLPIFYCGRKFGCQSALWTAAFSILFLSIALPESFALLMALQLIAPAAFITVIANLTVRSTPLSEGGYIPLAAILSSTALLITISTLIWAACLNNIPHFTALLDDSISEMTRILTLMRTLPAQQISQLEELMRGDYYALIVRMFAVYSFVIALLNFYIASRLGRNNDPMHRPRDHWPNDASYLPRIQVVLLVGASGLSLLPLNPTLQNCLDLVSQVLLMSFTLTGLAAIHLITRGKSWRPLVLTVLYGFLLPLFASLILAMWGILVSTTSLLKKHKNHLKSSL